MVEKQPVKLDEAQAKANLHLDGLSTALNGRKKTRLSRLLTRTEKPPKGIYLWGEVGRGKTMLMDQFFVKASIKPKRRIHFHAFMQEVHKARSKSTADDVISEIADHIAASAKLLCLDEMQVSDIADAMILGRLFEALITRNVVIVTTSNASPDQLYKDGLNRQLFLPFIEKLKSAFDVVHLGNGKDYRLGRIAEHDTYLTPLNKTTDAKFEKIWAELADGEVGSEQTLVVLGRKLHIPHVAHSCARFSFAELCENPLGAADYLAIAKNFHTVFVGHVRVLKASERNEAKRFILAVDTFYDAKINLIISAEAPPEQLCTTGPHKGEFLRTASRLREMQSKDWWAKPI